MHFYQKNNNKLTLNGLGLAHKHTHPLSRSIKSVLPPPLSELPLKAQTNSQLIYKPIQSPTLFICGTQWFHHVKPCLSEHYFKDGNFAPPHLESPLPTSPCASFPRPIRRDFSPHREDEFRHFSPVLPYPELIRIIIVNFSYLESLLF